MEYLFIVFIQAVMLKFITLSILLWSVSPLCSQNTLTGKIYNAGGEELEGASVFIVGSNSLATISDHEGIYYLENIPTGSHTLKITYVGYEDYTKEISVPADELIDIRLSDSNYQLDRIDVVANRLEEESAFSYIQMDEEDLALKNLGQDIPFLVEHTPSMVVTSDAGAGIGYTGMRIRGSDATRINVTINGVPLNDSESHGVFWVDLPDFSSSVNSLQIQRGVGPSTNGSGAFGGSVGLNTNYIHQNPFLKADLSYGSFNTRKIGLSLSTGLMNNAYVIEGRYSLIDSDGYIDRASSDLSSWYFSVGKIGERHSLKFNAFSGKERTYQAWNGVPQVKLEGTTEELLEHYFNNSNGDYNTVEDSLNLFDSGRTYNAYTYENQVDDYKQDHFQLLYALQPTEKTKVNLTGHYTRGLGFFEQFLFQEDLCDYVDCDSTSISNLARRRWLDNHFIGAIANVEQQISGQLTLTLGGSGNIYLGDHYGEIVDSEDSLIRAEIVQLLDNEYYRSDATKLELNSYLQAHYKVNRKLKLFGDMQVKSIDYDTEGTDNDQSSFLVDTSYLFINPKLGLSYSLSDQDMAYASFAVANREPVRSDFLDAVGIEVPQPERLFDFELGYRTQKDKWGLEANLYYMSYQNQLVVTGALNDVGGPVRTNVDASSRIGLELSAVYKINEYLSWSPNLTLSRNKIDRFEEFIADYGPGMNEINVLENSDLALSPSVIAGSNLSYNILEGFNLTLLSKYVGKQFLDNTSNDNRALSAYLINDLVATYDMDIDLIEDIQFKLVVNNLLNTKYSSNGYTYSYIVGDAMEGTRTTITENYLYPQAGLNFLLGASVKF